MRHTMISCWKAAHFESHCDKVLWLLLNQFVGFQSSFLAASVHLPGRDFMHKFAPVYDKFEN